MIKYIELVVFIGKLIKGFSEGKIGGSSLLYIGVDLGTSAVKLLMMDASGDVKKVVSREYPLFFPQPGWSEQHPEDWFT